MSALNLTATQQIASKDEQIKNLEDQIANWTKNMNHLQNYIHNYVKNI